MSLALLAGAAACTQDRLLTPGAPGYATGPVPIINLLYPAQATAGQTLTLDVRGSRFDPTSKVELDGKVVATSYRSGSYLVATIPAEPLGAGRDSAQVRVRSQQYGLSAPAYLRVVNPAPVMTAATPDTVWLGNTTVVRVTGSGFVQTSTIRLGGIARATRYVSPTTLETTILDTETLARGPQPVAVASPAPGGGYSAAGSLVVAWPRPVITGMHTSAARGGFLLTVYGKNLTANTLVTVDGQSTMATRVSSTRVTAGVNGRLPGTYYVRVFTVESGQASADSLALQFRSAPTTDGAPQVSTIDTLHAVTDRALAVDPGSGQLYVGGRRGAPGTMSVPYLWSIDPATSAVGGWVTNLPPIGALAVAPSGTVFAAGPSAVYRFSPAYGHTVGAVTTGSTVYDLAVSRDSVVAVSYADATSTAVAIWRPGPLGGSDPGLSAPLRVPADVVEWSDSSRTLFGYDGLTAEHGIRRMSVGAGAPVLSDLATGVTQAYNADMVYAAGRLYLSSGEVIDSETRALLGRCYVSGAVRPDPASGQIYYLNATSIQVCDLNTFQVIGSIALPGTLDGTGYFTRPGVLLRWGSDGLAFHDASRLYLLRSPVIAP
jgi:hypothetical protein